MSGDGSSLARLEARLGYRFRDGAQLRQALTHSSACRARIGPSNNERLEFLGDRVLGLVVAEMVYEAHPGEAEGQLARRYNRLVRRETLAEIARQLDFGDAVILGESEQGAGGANKCTILADACEAVLGAVYLDGGLTPARELIRRLWQPILCQAGCGAADAKTTLQEWAQARRLDLPRYLQVSAEGPDHAPRFTIDVVVGTLHPARGEGASKRIAEMAAAAAMLKREGVWPSC